MNTRIFARFLRKHLNTCWKRRAFLLVTAPFFAVAFLVIAAADEAVWFAGDFKEKWREACSG